MLTIHKGRVHINEHLVPDALRRNRPNREDANDAAAVIEVLLQQRDELLETLHHISLCASNSMSSRNEMGRIARNAIAKAKGETS